MKEQIEINRKVFEVEEKLGDKSFKVSRKGKFFFLKKYGDDKNGFEEFVDHSHYLKVSGVCSPKVYTYDKKNRVAVTDFIEGENIVDKLIKEDLSEDIVEMLFKTFWYAKADKMMLDFDPINFIYSNGKLYYLSFKYQKYVSNDQFIQKDIRLWFYTKEFINYLHAHNLEADEERLTKDYELNKKIALLTVKYYR